MRNYRWQLACALPILSFGTVLLNANLTLGQIKPYSENPLYWEYQGEPVLLFGASDSDNIFQWAGEGSKLTDHLDLLADCGGNYIRCTMSSRSYTEDGHHWDRRPYPFAKIKGKYDLSKWNDVYWNKLRTFLAETSKRDINVQLEFWDRWNESGDSGMPRTGWYDSPWNPNNNTTYDWEDSRLLTPGQTDFYNSFHYAAVENDPVLLPLQQRFVRKVIDEVVDGGFDHVIFQVDNESGIGDETLQPDPYWARFVREYGKSKGAEGLYVSTQRRFHTPTTYKTKVFQDWDNPEIRVPILNDAFNYCDISQNNGSTGQPTTTSCGTAGKCSSTVPDRSTTRRPITTIGLSAGGFDSGKQGTDTEAGARLWRAVFAGAASFRFHRRTTYAHQGMYPGFGLNDTAQRHLRSMRLFVDGVWLYSMEPHNDLLTDRADDEAYCLAEPGKQYAVFFTGNSDRSVILDLSAAHGELPVRWLDVARSSWDDPLSVRGAAHTLRPPDEGQWVAVLRSGEARIRSN